MNPHDSAFPSINDARTGLSIRAYLAAKVLAACVNQFASSKDSPERRQEVITCCIEYVDDMLVRLNEGPK